MPRIFGRLVVVCCLFALVGCNSYDIMQTSHFANDDAEILRVDYGYAERDHVNTFVSPANGQELEFHSRLVVEVTLPDGEDFTAWQCMNFGGNGTMYRTDDGEWFFLASGFTCKVARQDEDDPKRYNEVFRGVLCNRPEQLHTRENTKWHRETVIPRGKTLIRK